MGRGTRTTTTERRPPGPSPDATREAILAAAERLYAERGFHGVSLREIAEAAGTRNNAAVHYHFGGRDELVRTLFERRFVEIDARRAELLAALDADGRGDALEALVALMVEPFTERLSSGRRAGADGGAWVRLVARMHEDPRFNPFGSTTIDRRPYLIDPASTEATREVGRRIQAALGIDRDLAVARFFLMTTMVVHAVADREALASVGAAAVLGTPTELTERLVQAAVAILRGAGTRSPEDP